MLNNSRLTNMFVLSSKVTIYVPATTGVDVAIDNTKYVENVGSVLSSLFGGATSSPALGMWMSPTAGLVKENTTMVFAYCSDVDLQNNIDTLIDTCENLKMELEQEAIAMEINGSMYFI